MSKTTREIEHEANGSVIIICSLISFLMFFFLFVFFTYEIDDLGNWNCYNKTIVTADLVWIEEEPLCKSYEGINNSPSAKVCIGFSGYYINKTIEKEVCEWVKRE